jgi:hypothetical protein
VTKVQVAGWVILMFETFKRRQSNEEQIDELLSAYLDSMLTPAERASLETRLEGEPALRDRLEGLRWTVQVLADLPEVEVPRNFILSPSMVSAPRPAVQPRQRRSSPAFGWATAVATLLFLFILAGDFLFVAPSVRREPTDTVAQESRLLMQATGERETRDLESEPAVELAEAERPVRPEKEEKMAPATEAPVEIGEAEIAPTEEAQVGVVEAEPPAPAGREQDEQFQTEAPPKGLAPASVAQEPSVYQETPSLSSGVTTTVEGGAAVVGTPAPLVAEPEEELPMSASPPAEGERADSDAGAHVLQEQEVTAVPEPVAVVPLEGAPPAAGTEEAAEGVSFWLRLVEVGLGLVVVGLAMATLIARRREA